jgi:hypothetical protein
MIITTISIILTIIISFSFGVLTERTIEKLDPQTTTQKLPVPILMLLGFFLISLFLMLIHFFFPIGSFVYLLVFSTSIIIIWIQRLEIKKILSRKYVPDKKQLMLFPFLITCGLILILRGIDPVFEYDLGLYHLQNINWFQTYPIVPGLGNLHGRFAFNSNWFLLEALFGNRSIFGQPIFPINAICIFIFLLFSLKILYNNRKNPIFGKLLIGVPFLSIFLIFGYLNSAGTDKPCDILIWIIVTLFFLKLENNTIQLWDKYSWTILLLSIFVFTIKVSSAIILLLPGALLVLGFNSKKKILVFPVLISILYLSIWFIRNSIIAGAIVFPMPFLSLPFLDWAIPKSLIIEMTHVIHSWAVQPYASTNQIEAMSFIESFITWNTNKTFSVKLVIAIGLLGNFIYSIYEFREIFRKSNKNMVRTISLLILHCYFWIALVYWYLSAPDPRFAYGIIFSGFSLIVARIANKLTISKILIDGILLSTLVLSAGMAYIFVPWNQLSDYFLYPPKVPTYEIKEVYLADGNLIYQTTEGDQCWDAPLPCTGWVYDGLIMRSNNISDGFKIEK